MLLQQMEDQLPGTITHELNIDPSPKKPRKWTCTLPETLIGCYFIIPLTTVGMLKSESYRMNNTSIDYAHQCANMEYCIFSIRSRTGEPLATLGLSNVDGYWQLDWCSGPSLTEVLEESVEYLNDDSVLLTEHYPTELYYVVHEVIRLMNSDRCN